MPRPLYISRPLLPDENDMAKMIHKIWQNQIVTNSGPLHNQLEEELGIYLNVPTAKLFNNGTIALLATLKMFNFPVGSEIITTPLTFAATAHSVKWNGLQPIFADVIPHTLTIDPEAVERAVTEKTKAILAVHVYGNVCEVDALQEIADKYDLKLIYDAAHVFGATVNGRSIGSFGDASVFSFHATKLFNTIEGGLISTPRSEDAEYIYYLRNFGIKNEEEVVSIGINGKMNEMQAAVGLLNLPKVSAEKELRCKLREQYCERLSNIAGVTLPPVQKGVTHSEQYFPLIINPNLFGKSRDDIYNSLRQKNIFARKYFHPICTDFVPYKAMPTISCHDVPYVNIIKNQVLCLPFHSGVEQQDIDDICNTFL